jgi:FxsC-like protein
VSGGVGPPPYGGAGQSYFWLSYAHSLPLAEGQLTPVDARVKAFFDDLSEAVRRRARQSHLATGYFDQEVPFAPGDRKAALERAIGAAEIFVPLYSPGYLARSWPGREWACFEQRMLTARVQDPLHRFAPVLWVPLPPGSDPPGLSRALNLVPRAAALAYAQNGLLALMRLAAYRANYALVVDQLAALVVQTAEEAPVGPSPVPDISQVQSPFTPASDAAVFVVWVAAPALHEATEGSNRVAYGASASAWRPFAREQELSLADYAAMAAEQLDFAVQVIDIGKPDGLPGHAPGVTLIDPWYIADSRRLTILRQVASALPPWVLPVLVPDARGDTDSVLLAENVRLLLGHAQSEPARQALSGVTSLLSFTRLMPFLVNEAERAYLKYGPPGRAMASEPHDPVQQAVVIASSRPAIERPQKFTGHVFISYVREDSAQAARLQELLHAAGIPVWRDTEHLWPGEDWRVKIRHAITHDALVFLACFSSRSQARDRSYQNEELMLAIEQLRQRFPEDPWLIPIRFDECDIPNRDIGDGRTLQSLHHADLFGDRYNEEAARLVAAIKRMLSGAKHAHRAGN